MKMVSSEFIGWFDDDEENKIENIDKIEIDDLCVRLDYRNGVSNVFRNVVDVIEELISVLIEEKLSSDEISDRINRMMNTMEVIE